MKTEKCSVVLKETIESKPERYVWSLSELVREFNKRFPRVGKNTGLTKYQVATVIKLSHQYRTFKHKSRRGGFYIFVKRK